MVNPLMTKWSFKNIKIPLKSRPLIFFLEGEKHIASS